MKISVPKEAIERMQALAARASTAMDALEAGKAPQALKEFDEILQEAPFIRMAGLGKGLALIQMGQIADAIEFLSDFVVKYPDYPEAVQLRQRLLCGSDDRRPLFQKAVEYVRRNPSCGEIKKISCGVTRKTELEVTRLSDVTLQGEYGLLVVENVIKLWGSTIWGNIDAIFLPILKRLSSPAPVMKRGEYLPLYGFWSDGFYHLMLEWLPKVVAS